MSGTKKLRFHATNYKSGPEYIVYNYCHNLRPCYLEIQDGESFQKHEICCFEHLDKILQNYETSENTLYITISLVIRKNYIHKLLQRQWRAISIYIAEKGEKTLPNNGSSITASDILSLGTDVQQIIFLEFVPYSCLRTILILLQKDMIYQTVEIRAADLDTMTYLQGMGFDGIDLAKYQRFDFNVILTKHYFQLISQFNGLSHYQKYDFNELNL